MDRRKFVGSALATSLLISSKSTSLFDLVNPIDGVKKWKSFALFTPDTANEIFSSFKKDLYTKTRIGLEFTDFNKTLLSPTEAISDLISGKFDLAIIPPFALNVLGPEAEFFGQYSHLSDSKIIEDWHQKSETKSFWSSFFAEKNLVPFHFALCEHGGLWSKNKIENLTDFLNLRMRVMGQAQLEVSSLGGNAKFSTYNSISNKGQNIQIDANEGFSPHLDASLNLENGFNYYYLGWPKKLSYLGIFIKKSSYEALSPEDKNNLNTIISNYYQNLTAGIAVRDRAALQNLAATRPDSVQFFPSDVISCLKSSYEARLASLKINIPIS